MQKRILILIFGTTLVLLITAGYLFSTWNTGTATDAPSPSPIVSPTASPTVAPSASPTASQPAAPSSAPTEIGNYTDHEEADDYTWDASVVTAIALNGNTIRSESESVLINETTATITKAGTYSISGSLNNGQIVVNTTDEGAVRLILNGINIISSTDTPIYVANADKTVIVLAENTKNFVADTTSNESNATLFSKDDLTIYGSGSLTVNGNSKDAIRSNDGLIIKSGTITVSAVDDGICGKDYLVIKSGKLVVNSGGDCLKADNDADINKGYVSIQGGSISVTSVMGDAITAQTGLLVHGGTFSLNSGGGSNNAIDATISTKGLKAGVIVAIDDGVFTINSSDDSIHSSGNITINGGTFALSTGDDAVHADSALEVNGGNFDVAKSFEGFESAFVTINGGDINIISSDDGIATAGNNTGDATNGDISINNGVMIIASDGDAIQATNDIVITGGEITLTSGGGSGSYVDESASAKGVKADVSITITGGTIAADSADDAIHSNDKIVINGGTFTISTGDDGAHADTSLEINGGDINIKEAYEGLESATITINNGNIHITSSDDGINLAGGNDNSGLTQGPGVGGRPDQWGGPGQGGFETGGNYSLYINGGYIAVDALGDGIDSNGMIEMTGGSLIINGPVSNMNGALDFVSSNITGGFLLAVGSSGMAQTLISSSTQDSVLLNFGSTIQADTLVHIQTSDGDELLTFKATKQFQSIAFSSAELVKGVTYDLYIGGSSTGTAKDGLYVAGTYTQGTLAGSFTA